MIMNPEELFDNAYTKFEAQDPFNNNLVTGYLCRVSDDRYGALLIETVNGVLVPQLILCTPKLTYPFGKTGQWHVPKARKIERYEKLDGTNIFSYVYQDAAGQDYVTYKTRLTPFVQDAKFGPFLEMTKTMIAKYPYMDILPLEEGVNVSYELWGANNPHLIRYDTPLEMSILFLRKDGKILPPSTLDVLKGIPRAYYSGCYEGSESMREDYERAQQTMDEGVKADDDGYYSGTEGEVWYLLTEDGTWRLFKCKGNTIEQIHWAAGGISKNVIVATCENSFENWDKPTVENIEELLLEEFSEAEIDKVHYRVAKYLTEVIDKHELIEQVMKDYRSTGMNILKDKAVVMRSMSSMYGKSQMKKVYAIIMAQTVM